MNNKVPTEIKLAELYDLDYELVHDISIDSMCFSVRVNHCFKRHNPPIETVGDLMKYSIDDLWSMRNFGAKCVEEVESAIQSLQSKKIEHVVKPEPSTKNKKIFRARQITEQYRDYILNNDLSFLNHLEEEDDPKVGQMIKEAYDDLGFDLIKNYICNRNSMALMLAFIEKEARKYNIKPYPTSRLKKSLDAIPRKRLSNKIEGFIYAYTQSDGVVEQLLNWIQTNNYEVFGDINTKSKIDSNSYNLIVDFLDWCRFDLSSEINSFLDALYKDKRREIVARGRAGGKKLNEIGNELGITRERVRQIEKKLLTDFNSSFARRKIILKIYAIRNQDDVLRPDELQDYFGEETSVMLYFLRRSNSSSYVYNRFLDVWIVANEGLSERTSMFMEELPDTFHQDKLKTYIRQGTEEHDLSEEIIITAIGKAYKVTGNVYHREGLKLSRIYELILSKYFKEGLHVYDGDELKVFREKVKENFGDVSLSSNDRALSARICDVGILCGRGKYRPKQEKYISDELKKTIFSYIDKSEQSTIPINMIYSEFEEQLNNEGVDNRYYLQGILREYFDDQFYFKRDYISKNQELTSFHEQIVYYIRKSAYPVKKQELHEAFPGVTDIVFTIATNDPEIINLFGRYIHASRLNITEAEKNYLRKCVDDCLANNNPIHCKVIYERIAHDYPSILLNNYIDYPVSLYSVLEWCFRDGYEFSRPFLGIKDTSISKVKDLIRETIVNSDEMSIDDIRLFANDNRITIQSMLNLLNSCNDTHVIADRDRVISIELTGLDENVAKNMEDLIYNTLGEHETTPIANLECISQFPKIDIPWTAWLIYSVIRKWGTRLDVDVSSSFLRNAIPLVSRKGELSVDNYKDTSADIIGEVYEPDDLKDIDDVIATFSEDDWKDLLN